MCTCALQIFVCFSALSFRVYVICIFYRSPAALAHTVTRKVGPQGSSCLKGNEVEQAAVGECCCANCVLHGFVCMHCCSFFTGSTFGVYGLLSLLVLCYTYFCIPEAADLSLEESAPDGSGPSAWLSILVRQRCRFLQTWGRGRNRKVTLHDGNEEEERGQTDSRDVQALVEEGRVSPPSPSLSPTTSKQEEEETRGGGRTTRGPKAVVGAGGGGGENILQEIELQQQSFGA